MIADLNTKIFPITRHCPSMWNHTPCAMSEHHGTPHWNGKLGDDRITWTDAMVIHELQKLVENLVETNTLFTM